MAQPPVKSCEFLNLPKWLGLRSPGGRSSVIGDDWDMRYIVNDGRYMQSLSSGAGLDRIGRLAHVPREPKVPMTDSVKTPAERAEKPILDVMLCSPRGFCRSEER